MGRPALLHWLFNLVRYSVSQVYLTNVVHARRTEGVLAPGAGRTQCHRHRHALRQGKLLCLQPKPGCMSFFAPALPHTLNYCWTLWTQSNVLHNICQPQAGPADLKPLARHTLAMKRGSFSWSLLRHNSTPHTTGRMMPATSRNTAPKAAMTR